jgi:GNAT superfamily N-acetyltransferase
LSQLLNIQTPEQLDSVGGSAALPEFDVDDLIRHGTDAHRVLVGAEGRPLARCSLWWKNTPPLVGHRLGLIGHYAACSARAAAELLERACTELSRHGCTRAVGPMDGSTWRRYRFVTDSGSAPVFFLEPANPAEWPRHFVEAGFAPLAHYYSSVTDRLDYVDPKATRARERLAALGVRLRPLDISRWEDELKEIYRVTTASFQNGFLYQPLSEAQFRAQYQGIKPCLRQELVILATHEKRIVGYALALPDVNQAHRGEAIDTVILKTLSIVPDRSYAGLGSWLFGETHRVARALGFRRVVHALMHEANASLNISARYGKAFRRYTLFARPL